MMRALILGFFIAISAQAAPISEIQIEGEGFAQEQILQLKSISGFLPGDEFDSARNERAKAKFIEYFKEKGFPDIRVNDRLESSDPSRIILQYQFFPGEPVKLASIEVKGKTEKIPQELVEKLLSQVELRPDETLDQERLKEIRRQFEVVLLSQNFIDSRVVDVQTEKTGDRSFQAVFFVDLGQRVIFSVSGNDYFSRNELAELIEEQRQVGLGRDYVSVLTNRLLDHYRNYGFRSVQIIPYPFEASGDAPRKVVFEIQEGPRFRINKLIFDGMEVFSQSELESLFYRFASDRIRARIFNEKMIEDAASATIQELKNRGFLSAKWIAIKTEDVARQQVNIRIFISEGTQTSTQSIDFGGNTVFSSDELKNMMGVREDQPLNLTQLENGLEKIKREYRNLGYLDVKIGNENSGNLVTYSERNQFAFITVELEEGQVWKYGGFRVFGIEKTKPVVIEREILLHPGDPISEKLLIETEDRLRRLGLFSQLVMELVPSDQDPQQRILKISVVEAIPGNMGLGIGLRNDLGVRLFSEVSYANLWGLNHAWVFNLSGNRRIFNFTGNREWSNFRFIEFSAQMGYIWPWFVLGETTFRPNFSVEKRQYREFDAETYALSANFDRLLLKSPRLFGTLTYTIEQVRQFNALDTTQNQQIRIGSITPQLRLDLRDNPVAPKRGFFALNSFEYASSFLGSQESPIPVSYGRFQTRNDFYLDFIPRVVWYTSIRGGWLKNFANSFGSNSNFSIPLIKQFALGGVNSMRGYLEQELNVQAADKDRRVQNFMTYVNYRTQLDFFVSQNLSVGPFLDAGNLNVDRFDLGGLQYGTGAGLRYMTPVGPVNFDWGFKLFPKTTTDTNVFYFSLGVN